ncbi:MAG: tRNA (adenosine(37)-N6)-threonylcarbamoyltransferase complex ATPase subunit type 1 TsaE [Actinomycetales bacterium]
MSATDRPQVRTGPEIGVDTPEQMREFGVRLAARLRPGDLVLLTGDLGAGKTTLAAGIGQGLGVRGRLTSPTFVIAREHPAVRLDGVPIVHVDAYRLGGMSELEDLDLEASLSEAVTLVEWGHGLAEGLAEDRLELLIERSDEAADERRRVRLVAVGERWEDLDLAVES